MTAWSSFAPEPFASNREFWRSVGASVDGLLMMLVAAFVVTAVGPWGLLTFAAPVALLVRAGVTGRRSMRATRPLFADRRAWREAERQAVALVFFSALIRKRWPFTR
jgi:hypothetical protein